MRIPHPALPAAILAAVAACAGSAHADTMYKCTDPSGKVSYSDQPCAGQSKTRTLEVIAPKSTKAESFESAQAGDKQETELQRLRRADAEFKERLEARERSETRERMRAAERRANQRESDGRQRRQQEQQDAEADRQEALARARARPD